MAHIDWLGDPNHSSLNFDKDVFPPDMRISHIFSPFLCEIPYFRPTTKHSYFYDEWGRMEIYKFLLDFF